MDIVLRYINLLSFIALGVVGFYAIRSKVKNSNLSDLKDRVGILEKELQFTRDEKEKDRQLFKKELADEIKTRQELHLENQKSISNLEGQLATYKEIPLKSIAASLEQLPKLVESNQEILDTLKGSAVTAEKAQANGGLLVKTKEENPLDVKVREQP